MIQELINPKTDTYLKIKDTVLGVGFPWYFNSSTIILESHTTKLKKAKINPLGFYGHSVLMRSDLPNDQPVKNSSCFEDCLTTMREILNYNSIEYKGFYRINFNATHYIDDNLVSDPHVDHAHPHYNMLIYLNSGITGNTILYKEKYPNDIGESYVPFYENNLQIEEEIIPEEDKVVIFSGDIFHSQRYPEKHNRRIVLVSTFL